MTVRRVLNKLKQAVSKTKNVVNKIQGFTRNPVSSVGGAILSNIINRRAENVSPDEDVLSYKKFAKLGSASVKDKEGIGKTLDGSGYNLDDTLSSDEIKVFTNPTTKNVTVSYRGTALDKPSRWKDLKSDWAIATGQEKKDRRFRQAKHHFNDVLTKYGKNGFKINTTGHSLGGQLSKYINDEYRGRVNRNVAFSRGAGFLEPFRRKQPNTIDVSNKNDIISLGARLQGGKQMIEKKNKGLLESHNLTNLFA